MRLVIPLLLLMPGLSLAAAYEPRTVEDQYALHCMGCHGPQGRGLPPDIPDVTRSLTPLLATPEGRDYVLRVPGVSRSALPPEQLAAILNWMRHEFAPDSVQYPAFTPAEVAAGQQQQLTDPFATRGALLADDSY